MKFSNTPNISYISKEDNILRWYSRSSAVVAHVIFIDDNNNAFYLVGKRGENVDQPNKYNIPCGYFDWDENLRGTMFREVWEETGLDLSTNYGINVFSSIEQPWFVNTNPNQNRQNISFHTGIVIQLGKDEELPQLSLDNMEEGEATMATLMPVSMLDMINDDEWAFNHNERIKDFIIYLRDKDIFIK